MLQSFKEPLETKPGEINVRYLPTNPFGSIDSFLKVLVYFFLLRNQARKVVHKAWIIWFWVCSSAVDILPQVLQLDQVQDQAAELIVTIMTVIWYADAHRANI